MAKDRKIDMVILGLLSHENLTGYDIKKRIDGGISFFWKGSFGSIYPSLNAMEKEGLIIRTLSNNNSETNKSTENEKTKDNEKKDKETKGRAKILYSITDTGVECLKTWLEDSKVTNDLKYETLLKLFFGGVAETEITIKNIKEFETDIRKSLAVLKAYQDNLEKVKDDKEHLYYYLTVSFGVTTYEGYLKWCEESLKMLKAD